MNNLLIIGAGGHGKVVLDTAVSTGHFDEICFLDDHKAGETLLGYKIIGPVSDYLKLKSRFNQAIVAIGQNKVRLSLMENLEEAGYILPVLIHPTAYVSPFAVVGAGTVIMPKAVVNAGAKVGKGVIINTASVVEHDNQIDSGVHLSPNVSLGGSVHIGKLTWVGIGATVINNITIGEGVMVAAGAVVIKDVAAHQMMMGIPAEERLRTV